MLVVAPAAPAEGEWRTVMGADFLFAPIDRPMLIRARRAAREVSRAEAGDEAVSAIDMIEDMGDAMSRALILEGLKGWRHVATAALGEDGQPRTDKEGDPVFHVLAFTPENVALVLSDPVIFEAIDAAYVAPFVLRERERAEPGNAFAASPTGTGEAATPASDTATSPAKHSEDSAAESAPTSSKSRGRSKRKTPGRF